MKSATRRRSGAPSGTGSSRRRRSRKNKMFPTKRIHDGEGVNRENALVNRAVGMQSKASGTGRTGDMLPGWGCDTL